MTGVDGADAADTPMAFSDVTVNVYAVPLVSPVKMHEVGDRSTLTSVEQVAPPGEAVAV
jgi:hypothetical protein